MAIDDFVQPQFDDHLMILDNALRLCMMDRKGYVMYITQNDWKCGRSFLTIVTNGRIIFSIFGSQLSSSRKALDM